jgi:hypothetical protein
MDSVGLQTAALRGGDCLWTVRGNCPTASGQTDRLPLRLDAVLSQTGGRKQVAAGPGGFPVAGPIWLPSRADGLGMVWFGLVWVWVWFGVVWYLGLVQRVTDRLAGVFLAHIR